jgi:hypothetical protein
VALAESKVDEIKEAAWGTIWIYPSEFVYYMVQSWQWQALSSILDKQFVTLMAKIFITTLRNSSRGLSWCCTSCCRLLPGIHGWVPTSNLLWGKGAKQSATSICSNRDQDCLKLSHQWPMWWLKGILGTTSWIAYIKCSWPLHVWKGVKYLQLLRALLVEVSDNHVVRAY